MTEVDPDALHAALRGADLRGAAIDVFPVEPASSTETLESPLGEPDNVTQLHLKTAGGMGAAMFDLNAPLDAVTLADVQRVDVSVRAFVALARPVP